MVPYGEKLESVFESEDILVFIMNSGIVAEVNGGFLFPSRRYERCSHARSMACFEKEEDLYKVTEKQPS